MNIVVTGVTWMVDGTAVDTSPDRISTAGATLIGVAQEIFLVIDTQSLVLVALAVPTQTVSPSVL